MRQETSPYAILPQTCANGTGCATLSKNDTKSWRETDAALVKDARGGRVGAFEGLYRRNVGRTYALCMRLTGDPSLSEDLTQEAFVRAWEKLGTFRGESAFSSWLHRLTVNVVYSERRTRLRRETRLRLLEKGDGLTRHNTAVHVDLEEAVAKLPEGARRTFVLHDVEGYKHEEIAEMTGTAVGTSKAQLHRARRLLREELSR